MAFVEFCRQNGGKNTGVKKNRRKNMNQKFQQNYNHPDGASRK